MDWTKISWDGLDHWQQWTLGIGCSLVAAAICYLIARLFRADKVSEVPVVSQTASPVVTQTASPSQTQTIIIHGAPIPPVPQAVDAASPAVKPASPPEQRAFYYSKKFTGASHSFLGRSTELEWLRQWALSDDSDPMFLFEAIGGSGKSHLTWTWVKDHAPAIRSDWAGRFWYSFYEAGANMDDFCRQLLTYMGAMPVSAIEGRRASALADELARQLGERPWLVVMDGLERVLVHYRRYNASEEERDRDLLPEDPIEAAKACETTRIEDGRLLKLLAGAGPSKILVTSRLVPTALMRNLMVPIDGVRRKPLGGLDPADAEALFRQSIRCGDSQTIRRYLVDNCGCHPLVIGALAGLVQAYPWERGNFDRWKADSEHGGRFQFKDLDLKGKQNHILDAAFDCLTSEGRELLSLMAFLPEGVAYDVLSELNPFRPPEPETVEPPDDPNESPWWDFNTPEECEKEFQGELARYRIYEQALVSWRTSESFRNAAPVLDAAINDLLRRGLLQVDDEGAHYDLHPVVRAVIFERTKPEQRDGHGRRVVDYLTAKGHRPYENAKTLGDLEPGLHILHTLLKMHRYQDAYQVFEGDLYMALLINLEEYWRIIGLIEPFFEGRWDALPTEDKVDRIAAVGLVAIAGIAFSCLGQHDQSLKLWSFSRGQGLAVQNFVVALADICSISVDLHSLNRLADSDRSLRLALRLAEAAQNSDQIFNSLLHYYAHVVTIGALQEAEECLRRLGAMARPPSLLVRPGDVEMWRAADMYWRSILEENFLSLAEELTRDSNSRICQRSLLWLRGCWLLDQKDWSGAAESFGEAVRMANEIGLPGFASAAWRTLALLRCEGAYRIRMDLARIEADRISREMEEWRRKVGPAFTFPAERPLAELLAELGDIRQATGHALRAYTWACADGEPYVRRFELERTQDLLKRLGANVPPVPIYDETRAQKFPLEDEVRLAVEELERKKAAREDTE